MGVSSSASASESEVGRSSARVRLRFLDVEVLVSAVGALRLRQKGDLWAGSRVDQSSRG
jgi:hypothetical protein